MPVRYNPFTPNKIVVPGMFSGRVEELGMLEQNLFQTKHGNPAHFLIHGERGIGKSSLLLYTKFIASPATPALGPNKFITVDVEIEPSTDYEDLTKKIGAELARRLRAIEQIKSAASDAWSILSRWEILGIKYQKDQAARDPSFLLEDLCETMATSLERLGDAVDGIVVLIDEADKASDQVALGQWVKVFTERLTKRGCNKVCLGLSGISNVIDILRASHESSLRVLQHIFLEPLLHDERLYVIRSGLRAAEEVNKFKVGIDPDAADWIAKYSEGFPHFIQQYAYSAFETDIDDNINMADVRQGAFKDNGALDQLGTRYFEAMYRAQINSDEYRQVLHAMAVCDERYVSKQFIRDKTNLKETTLSNALQSLKGKNIIVAHTEKQGLYRLPNDSFGAWIRAQVNRESQRDTKKAF